MSLFDFLEIFNWPGKLFSIGELFCNDPTPLQTNSRSFSVPVADCQRSGWSINDIEDNLARYGIKVYGGSFHLGTYDFYVSEKQGDYAEWLLNSNGVPFK